MRAVIQRVSEAKVEVNNELVGSIGKGLLLLVGFAADDTQQDLEWICKKALNMRIFSDEEGKMNLSCLDLQAEVLIISQFTLYASTKKGNRPSFIKSAKPDVAIPLYEQFVSVVEAAGLKVRTGEFGADMNVSLVNAGPVTINLDSKSPE